MAEQLLRPTESSLLTAWREIQVAHLEQEERLRESPAPEDRWGPPPRAVPNAMFTPFSDIEAGAPFVSNIGSERVSAPVGRRLWPQP